MVSSCKYLSHPGNPQDGEDSVHVTGVPEMDSINAGINKTQTHQKRPCVELVMWGMNAVNIWQIMDIKKNL